MMICPECGAENPDGSTNCQRCQAVLQGSPARMQWMLIGFLSVAVAVLAVWRLGLFDRAGRVATPVETIAIQAGERLLPVSSVAEGGGVRLELPGGHWKVNGRDSPDKMLKNPAAEFEFVDTESLAYGLLIVEDSPLTLDGYVEYAKSQMTARYPGLEFGKEHPMKLGGESAHYLEFQVVTADKITFFYYVTYAVRNGKGYQLVFYTIPSLAQDLQNDLSYVFEHFRFVG